MNVDSDSDDPEDVKTSDENLLLLSHTEAPSSSFILFGNTSIPAVISFASETEQENMPLGLQNTQQTGAVLEKSKNLKENLSELPNSRNQSSPIIISEIGSFWSNTDVLDAAVAESFESVPVEGDENLLRSSENGSTPQLLHLPYTIAPRITTQSVDEENILSSLLMLESCVPPHINQSALEVPPPPYSDESCRNNLVNNSFNTEDTSNDMADILSLMENSSDLQLAPTLSHVEPVIPQDSGSIKQMEKPDWVDVASLNVCTKQMALEENSQTQGLQSDILKIISAGICKCTNCQCGSASGKSCKDASLVPETSYTSNQKDGITQGNCFNKQDVTPTLKSVQPIDANTIGLSCENNHKESEGNAELLERDANSCCVMVCLNTIKHLRMMLQNRCCEGASNSLQAFAFQMSRAPCCSTSASK